MLNVRLHGHIAKKFPGNNADGSWLLEVEHARDAVHAIEANRPGFFGYLVNSSKFGVEYQVLIDGKEIQYLTQLHTPTVKEYGTIDILPIVVGADSSGIWSVIAGVVLIIVGVVLSFFIPPAGGAVVVAGISISGATIGILAGALVGAGIGLAIGGIESLIFKPADASTTKNHASFLFNGQVNTTGQGGPVPICYGRLIVGSQLVSAYLTTVSIDPKSGDNLTDPFQPTDQDTNDGIWGTLGGRTIDLGSNSPGFSGVSTGTGLAGGGGSGGTIDGDGTIVIEEAE